MKSVRILAHVGFLVGVPVLAVVGCSLDRVSYDASGSYSARVTFPDGSTRTLSNFPVSRTGQITSDTFTDLCDVRNLTWGLPSEVVEGDIAALRARLGVPLCSVEGETPATGNAVLWGPPPGQPDLLTGILSDDWTVTGAVAVTERRDHGTPDLRVGEEAVIESARGTFHLEGVGPEDARIRLENGTFEFTIVARKYRFEP